MSKVKESLEQIISSMDNVTVINQLGAEFRKRDLIAKTTRDFGSGGSKKDILRDAINSKSEQEDGYVHSAMENVLNTHREIEERWLGIYRRFGLIIILISFSLLVFGSILTWIKGDIELSYVKDIASIIMGFLGGGFLRYYYVRTEKKLEPIIKELRKLNQIKKCIELRKDIASEKEYEKFCDYLLSEN